MEVWDDVSGFPGYIVSDQGQVCNERTGRMLTQTVNQQGIVRVGLVKDGVQYKCSVSLLVANRFSEPPYATRCNTIIHKDGDRLNNRYDNLAWRPRPFAIQYHKQFVKVYRNRIYRPLVLVESEEVFYQGSWPVVPKYGVLENAVCMSAWNQGRIKVFPINATFRYLSDLDTM